MKKQVIALAICMLVFSLSALAETSVSIKVSGPGVVNDSTLKVGEKVTFELYTTNDTIRTGFTIGMAIRSDDIKKIIHVADSGNGLNAGGDVKGHNGWHDKSVWDLNGVFIKENDWDGILPDLLGIGGIAIKRGYKKDTEGLKKLTWEVIIPEAGNLVIDSAFFPPGGEWMFSSPPTVEREHYPTWYGPYKYKVIK